MRPCFGPQPDLLLPLSVRRADLPVFIRSSHSRRGPWRLIAVLYRDLALSLAVTLPQADSDASRIEDSLNGPTRVLGGRPDCLGARDQSPTSAEIARCMPA